MEERKGKKSGPKEEKGNFKKVIRKFSSSELLAEYEKQINGHIKNGHTRQSDYLLRRFSMEDSSKNEGNFKKN